MTRLFLDHNATSPLIPAAREAMIAAMDAGNPSSVHDEGRKAKALLEQARADIAVACDAPGEGVIFTAGGTEAINTGLKGMTRRENEPVRRLFVSQIEHSAVLGAAKALEREGVTVEFIPTLADGRADTVWLKERLETYDPAAEGAFMVCLMLANNETGVLQDVSAVTQAIFARGGYLFVDATQALGKVKLSFNDSQADLMAVSAHKIGGPKGAGALLAKPAIPLAPLIHGGGQELRRRAGTESLITIAGFGAACRAIDLDWTARAGKIRDRIEAGLKKMTIDGLTIWGEGAPRLANTLCFSAPGFKAETQLMALDLAGIAVSAGSACSSGKVSVSHVLTAMGATDEQAQSAIRVSLGPDTPESAADEFLEKWRAAHERAAKRSTPKAYEGAA